MRGYGGYLLLAGFSENFRERSGRNFQKKLVAKGKSPMKKRLVMKAAALYVAKQNRHQPVSGEFNHLTLDREDVQAMQVLCTPGVFGGALPFFF